LQDAKNNREERKLAAIMLSDLVGFTSMAQVDEALAMKVLSEHHKMVRPILQKHSGWEVKTMGDSFLIEFPSALDAVRCATELQEESRRLNSSRSPETVAMMRIGIHVGDVIHSGGDIYGDAVNISSRIEPLARPGGICISGQTFDQVRNKVDSRFVKMEAPKLKNVNLPIEVYTVEMSWEVKGEAKEELDRHRVAILPLKNISPDPNDEYFADGMTEELIAALSGISGLTVIARTSVMRYKSAAKGVAEIGRELRAGTLVEGSVRKVGSKVRISIQLVDASNEGYLLASNYDRDLNDIFAVQSEIAQRVAEALTVKLLESDRQKLTKVPTGSAEAHTLYLKGRYYWNLRSREGLQRAIEYFNLAVEQDQGFAAGYSGLAECHIVMARNGHSDPATSYPKAKEQVLKALELDPNSAEAHAALANILAYYDHQQGASESEFRKALELNPNYASAHQWFWHLLCQQRRFDEGFAEIRRAMELDPLSRAINENFAGCLYYAGEFDAAITQYKKLLELDPNWGDAYRSLFRSYLRKTMYDDALAAVETYGLLSKKPFETMLLNAYVYASKGEREKARRLLAEVEGNLRQELISPFQIGLVHFLLGEVDSGFEWLERAFNERDPWIMWLNVEFELEGVRADPRFLSLLERVGLREGGR